MKKLFCIALIALALLTFSGCNAGQLARWTAARDAMKTELADSTQQIEQLQTQIATLPDGPAKREAQAALKKAQALLPTFQSKLDNLDTLITAARSGDPGSLGTSIGGMLTGVPIIGPYAGLIGLLAGIGWGLWQRFDTSKAVDEAQQQAQEAQTNLKNVVTSLENAGPDWTESDKANIAAIQGPKTAAAVEQIKKEL